MAVQTENELEVELKLLVSDDAGDIIQHQLLPLLLCTVEQSELELSNDYFDTPDRILRKHNIGFRIRGTNGVFEQTLKTAGKVLGGLHQRPEFNIPLVQPIAMLNLFDKKVWPKTIDVAELQKRLAVIFSTHFIRHSYLITFADGDQVELVWDRGEVVANRQQETICEIELELKQGSATKLFEIAKQIAALMPVRLSNKSKAARGYALCDGATNTLTPLPETLNLSAEANIETAFTKTLEVGLAQWQQHENQFLLHNEAIALHNMHQAIELIYSALAAYQSVLQCQPLVDLCKNLGLWLGNWQWFNEYYAYCVFASPINVHRKKLEKSPHLIKLLLERADACVLHNQPEKLLLNATNVNLQLKIIELLITMPWRQTSVNYLSGFIDFAEQQDNQQQKIIIELINKEQSWQGEDYLYHAQTIRDALHRGYLFEVALTNKYRSYYALCRDLDLGINKLKLWQQLNNLITTSNLDERESLLAWCRDKMSKLIHVMERSKENALVFKH